MKSLPDGALVTQDEESTRRNTCDRGEVFTRRSTCDAG